MKTKYEQVTLSTQKLNVPQVGNKLTHQLFNVYNIYNCAKT